MSFIWNTHTPPAPPAPNVCYITLQMHALARSRGSLNPVQAWHLRVKKPIPEPSIPAASQGVDEQEVGLEVWESGLQWGTPAQEKGTLTAFPSSHDYYRISCCWDPWLASLSSLADRRDTFRREGHLTHKVCLALNTCALREPHIGALWCVKQRKYLS